jgi:hypothetical protein
MKRTLSENEVHPEWHYKEWRKANYPNEFVVKNDLTALIVETATHFRVEPPELSELFVGDDVGMWVFKCLEFIGFLIDEVEKGSKTKRNKTRVDKNQMGRICFGGGGVIAIIVVLIIYIKKK